MKFVNLTPHEINVEQDGRMVSIKPEVDSARVEQVFSHVETVDGIKLFVSKLDKVQNLPNPEKGVIYIVSAMVKEREMCRNDLVSPGKLVRDDKGKVVGCEGFLI